MLITTNTLTLMINKARANNDINSIKRHGTVLASTKNILSKNIEGCYAKKVILIKSSKKSKFIR